MNILVINTAGERIQLGMEIDSEWQTYTCIRKELASVVLLAELDSFLSKNNKSLEEIDYFAAVVGPGSFTGIRIGVATIRAFCQSLNKRAISVNRLELLAYNIRNRYLTEKNHIKIDNIVSVVDGANGVSYVAVYDFKDIKEVVSPHAIKNTDFSSFISGIQGVNIVVADEEVDRVARSIPIDEYIEAGDKINNYVNYLINSGRIIDYSQLEPLYLRKSQAEREAGDL